VPLKRRAAPRAELMVWDGTKWVKATGDVQTPYAGIMGWDGSAWQKALVESATYPNLRVAIFTGAASIHSDGRNVDNASEVRRGLHTIASMHAFNDSKWDRWRNNTEVTVLASGTRTASGASPEQTNFNARGAIVFLYIYAVSGSFAAGEGLSIYLEAKDPASGASYRITPTIGPFTTTGRWLLLVYPGATDIGGNFEGENDIPLARTWRVRYDISGTNPSFTFSVGASYIV